MSSGADGETTHQGRGRRSEQEGQVGPTCHTGSPCCWALSLSPGTEAQKQVLTKSWLHRGTQLRRRR